ncbi:hypothetical protein [Paenibacillus woosongensis]|uniref:Uncharacterized protein n=1 Tax=Paenibacillus woosongensis TaxID=307580 RepID=A0A7X3CMV2_9BACL|nr:hypothetical protein [Paenibacillus woosongensis]MUG46033.1 hypothetical protein [Paenibacillus woosongensis]
MSDQILTQILGELKSLNNRMGNLEDKQETLANGQQALLTRQEALENGQQALLTRQEALENGQQALLTRQEALENGQQALLTRLEALETRQVSFEAELKEIKANTADIPLIRQAVLETLEITKRLDLSQKSFERKTTNQLNTHEYSIDIINRRQLKLEADLESIKNK